MPGTSWSSPTIESAWQNRPGALALPWGTVILPAMGFHQLIRHQDIPASIGEVWDFICRPENLREITPAYMGFEIISSEVPEVMYPGMIIAYKVRPVAGIPMTWVTEITHIEEGRYFVDEQRVGPYALWHHEHLLEPIEGGVRMTDIVSYRLPMGPLGDLVHALFVRRQLNSIFKFRIVAVEKRFGRFGDS